MDSRTITTDYLLLNFKLPSGSISTSPAFGKFRADFFHTPFRARWNQPFARRQLQCTKLHTTTQGVGQKKIEFIEENTSAEPKPRSAARRSG